ncbi:MAG: hypothetical protein FJ213_07180 [Ignavibacteria bacterium]|nr:hypothetical protein [Ignavibacteria bacterium]
MKLKYKYSKHFVTVFILIAGLLIVSAVTFMIISQKVLEKKLIYKAKFLDAQGLTGLTPVYFKGFNIGNITNFELTVDNYVVAEFEVFSVYRSKIVLNSALQKSLNPITGASTIQFIQGRSSSQQLKEGSLIPDVQVPEGEYLLFTKEVTKSGDALSTFVENLKNFSTALNSDHNADEGAIFRTLVNIADASEEMKSLIQNLNSNLSFTKDERLSPIQSSIQNISTLALSLNETAKSITLAFQRVDTLIANYSKPEGLIEKAIDPSGDQVLRPLGKTITSLGELTNEMKTFADYINSQSANMSLTIIELNRTLNQAQKFFDGINKSFFGSKSTQENKINLPGERIRLMNLNR